LKIAGRVAFFTIFSAYQPTPSNSQHIRWRPWNLRRQWHFGEHHRLLR
jgi:hypothetical protein